MPRAETSLTRDCVLECRALEKAGQYEISFSSETACMRGGIPEILLHDKKSVDLSRFENGSAPLLFAHGLDPNYGRVPVGRVVRAWLDAGQRKCRAIIEFDEEDESCLRLRAKMEKGMLTGVSVGYNVLEWIDLRTGQKSRDGRFIGPASLAARWRPSEISLEPTPADASVGLGRSLQNDEEDYEKMPRKEGFVVQEGTAAQAETNPMTRTAESTVVSATVAVPVAGAVPEYAASSSTAAETLPGSASGAMTGRVMRTEFEGVIAEERARVSEITSLCRTFEVDAQEFIGGGHTVDQVRTLVLDKLAKERTPVRAGFGGDVTVVQDEMDRVRSAAVDGMLLRSSVAVENPAAGATEFRGMSVKQIAAECLFRSGEPNVLRMGDEKLFERSMTPDSAFSAIMGGVANKVVLSAHAAAPTTYQLWTSKGTASDFKPTEYYEISASGSLDELPQNGEFKEGRLSDAPVAVRRLLTFGKKVSFTRQMFINDDVQMITRTIAAYVLAFARGTNKAVYGILKNSPKMYDGNPLFSGAHQNLANVAVPSIAAFSEARRLMRKQTDLGGAAVLNLSPAYILSGSYEETEIEKLLVSLADPSGNNSGVANVFRNSMQLVVDAELDEDAGAQPYYFAADPRLSDTIEVSFLNGNESPTVETKQEFDRLGLSFRVFGDRGVTLLGYKGLVKNPGKART